MKPVTRYSLYGLSALVVLLAVIAYMYVSKGSRDNPVELPESASSKVDGVDSMCHGSPYNRVFHAGFYNGSDWVVTSVDVRLNRKIKYKFTDGKETIFEERRTFRLTIRKEDADDSNETSGILMPFSNGDFEVKIGRFLDHDDMVTQGKFSWNIITVYGFKP